MDNCKQKTVKTALVKLQDLMNKFWVSLNRLSTFFLFLETNFNTSK